MSTPKRRTQPHGGRREGSGAPSGRRRKRRKLSYSHRKKATLVKKKEVMNRNYDHQKWDALIAENIQNKERIQELKKQVQEVYDRLGQYMERDDVESLIQNVDMAKTKKETKYVQFNLTLHLLYKSRVSYNNLPETVITIWSIINNVDPSEIKSKMISGSSMKR